MYVEYSPVEESIAENTTSGERDTMILSEVLAVPTQCQDPSERLDSIEALASSSAESTRPV